MASASGVADLLARVTALLGAVGIPYMLTGSFASTLFGAPRTTQDIDIVIEPTLGTLERLLHALPDSEPCRGVFGTLAPQGNQPAREFPIGLAAKQAPAFRPTFGRRAVARHIHTHKRGTQA